jgi:hypothetical protein
VLLRQHQSRTARAAIPGLSANLSIPNDGGVAVRTIDLKSSVRPMTASTSRSTIGAPSLWRRAFDEREVRSGESGVLLRTAATATAGAAIPGLSANLSIPNDGDVAISAIH